MNTDEFLKIFRETMDAEYLEPTDKNVNIEDVKTVAYAISFTKSRMKSMEIEDIQEIVKQIIWRACRDSSCDKTIKYDIEFEEGWTNHHHYLQEDELRLIITFYFIENK